MRTSQPLYKPGTKIITLGLRDMYLKAAAGDVRGWLLYIAGEPAAYLYCPIEAGIARYEYVGHDPAFSDLSPGGVLQMEAMRDLFGTGLKCFDFTEGDGQHKRQFATAGVPCIVSDQASLEAMVAHTVGEFGRLDILVNNAGMFSSLKM